MNKEEKKNTKLRLKWKFKLLLIIIMFIFYAFFIGTKGITIKEYGNKTNKINQNMDGIKILQFSDLHYGSSINLSDVKKLVNKINETKPDIVIFTGDLIDERYTISSEEKKDLTKLFTKVSAELGKYYITGEEDFEESISILNLSQFINIDDKEQLIYKNSNKPILLTSKNSLEGYFENNDNDDTFKVLAIHNPNEINDLKEYNIDIALAGHTHNGQVNIPKIKELFIKSDYKSDLQKINNTKLYINPGIGTSKINVRLFNRPTIYLFRITKTS